MDAFNRLFELVDNDRKTVDRRQSMESEFRNWLERPEKENAPAKPMKTGAVEVPRRSLEASMSSALLANNENKNAGCVEVSTFLGVVQNFAQP